MNDALGRLLTLAVLFSLLALFVTDSGIGYRLVVQPLRRLS